MKLLNYQAVREGFRRGVRLLDLVRAMLLRGIDITHQMELYDAPPPPPPPPPAPPAN